MHLSRSFHIIINIIIPPPTTKQTNYTNVLPDLVRSPKLPPKLTPNMLQQALPTTLGEVKDREPQAQCKAMPPGTRRIRSNTRNHTNVCSVSVCLPTKLRRPLTRSIPSLSRRAALGPILMCVCVYACARTYVRMHVCMYAHMYIRTHTHAYTYTYVHMHV